MSFPSLPYQLIFVRMLHFETFCYISEFLGRVANSKSKSNLNQETNHTDHSQMNGNSQPNSSSENSSAGKEYTSEQVEAVKR